MKKVALALTYSFPFWLFIDSRSPPELLILRYKDMRVRAYPPFRSAPNAWIPMPTIDPDKIPFIDGVKPDTFPKADPLIGSPACAVPVLKVDWPTDDGASIRVHFGNQPEERTDGKENIAVRMDSIRLDFLNIKPCKEWRSIDDAFTILLMRHLRVESGQWWITRSSDAVQGWKRHSIPIDYRGCPVERSSPHMETKLAGGFELPISKLMWKKALDQTCQSKEPLLYKELYLDAHYYHGAKDYRRMALDMASACEILKDFVFETVWNSHNKSKYRRGKILAGYDLPEHLDASLESLCGRSFKHEDEENYAHIANLWDTRGNLAHLGHAFYRENGQKVYIDKDIGLVLLSAAKACIEWLEKIIE